MLEAVKLKGMCLEFADVSLKRDVELVLAAFDQNYKSLEFAAPELLGDESFIVSAMRINEIAEQFASAEVRAQLNSSFVRRRDAIKSEADGSPSGEADGSPNGNH